jgi:hypothetical protein
MRISDQALDEFIELYRKEFGEEIGRNQASEMAFRLVRLYEALAQRPSGEESSTTPPVEEPHREPIGFRA